MMQHQVALQARFNPETLERVLRVVRHRGFQICAIKQTGGRRLRRDPATHITTNPRLSAKEEK